MGLELRGAGVDALVDRLDAQRLAGRARPRPRSAPELADAARRRTRSASPRATAARPVADARAPTARFSKSDDLLDLVEEPRVDAGQRCIVLVGPAQRRGRASRRRCGRGRASMQLLAVMRASVEVRRGRTRRPPISRPRRPFCSASLNVRPMAITSPTDFIWVPSRGLGVAELLEGPARDLDHHVVDRRLEAGRGHPGDVVRDLVEAVARRPAARRSSRWGSRWPCWPGRRSATPAGSSR